MDSISGNLGYVYTRALRRLAYPPTGHKVCRCGSGRRQIMGLMDTHAVRSDSTRPLAYLTGICQKKHKRECHLNEIEVNKLDTTLFEAKAKEVMDHVKNDPHNVDRVIERQMPYLCQEHTVGTDRMDKTSQSAALSPGEQELRQATQQFCAEKSGDNLRRCSTSGSRSGPYLFPVGQEL